MRKYTRGILAIVAAPVIITGAVLVGLGVFGLVELIPWNLVRLVLK